MTPRAGTMRLACMFSSILLFGAAGLLLFISLQDPTELSPRQVPGIKFSIRPQQPYNDLPPGSSRDGDLKAPTEKVTRDLSSRAPRGLHLLVPDRPRAPRNMGGILHRLSTYTKMLFVREPFERLVSAFRDKFEHPNSYYHPVFGKAILARYRANASREALRTGSGVRFPEFVQYLLDVHRPVGMDIHWDHVSRLCSPCLIDYDFVGKFESMEEDANFFLSLIRAPRNLTFPQFKDRHSQEARTTAQITHQYFTQLSALQRQRTYDFYYMDYLMFNYSKPFADLY
ncbi:carbohydrate sulfotransferase 8 [Lynx pardinus]|uniref:Carbohydrate sulfotransferase n=1 Tax=Lynx pardinus TaxID=191816 RepID=A0A485NLK1_LYNPA|nr:carbohydrate sulfotransferase 8 [Lynx pardinus]